MSLAGCVVHAVSNKPKKSLARSAGERKLFVSVDVDGRSSVVEDDVARRLIDAYCGFEE